MPRHRYRWVPTVVINRDGHDPWWDLEGDQAQSRRRSAEARARVALAVSVVADIAVIVGWAARVGLGHALGIHT
jgi:hypothetical protein